MNLHVKSQFHSLMNKPKFQFHSPMNKPELDAEYNNKVLFIDELIVPMSIYI